jgi:hypothetical protein
MIWGYSLIVFMLHTGQQNRALCVTYTIWLRRSSWLSKQNFFSRGVNSSFLLHFVFHFKPTEAEATNVECENSTEHLTFSNLFSISSIQTIVCHNAGLRLGPQTKAQHGEVHALYRPDKWQFPQYSW